MRRFSAVYLFLLLLPMTSSDTLRMSAAEEISAAYHFNVATWELSNFPSKWVREARDFLFPFAQEETSTLQDLLEYFSLGTKADRLQGQISSAAATGEGNTVDMETLLQKFHHQRSSLRSKVELFIEKEVSTALREKGIASGIGGLIFPPVDIALERPPRLLVISPRNRISLKESVLLTADISIQEQERLEERIFEEQNLSGLVDRVGGLSTYPSFITPTNLRFTLNLAAHEWLHHYLFFQPLGQNLYSSNEMRTLNETTANIFGAELGDYIYTNVTGNDLPNPISYGGQECDDTQFCFAREMRHTRLHVDGLLAQGKVLEAETYMEHQRQLLVTEGYPIRKLNQAYFAMRGNYADNPASISPIFEQLSELRDLSSSLAEFIHLLASISSYKGFEDLLVDTRKQSNKTITSD